MVSAVLEFKSVSLIADFVDCIRLRQRVFIEEQEFTPGWEPDAEDKTAQHFAAVQDGKLIATLRVLKVSEGEFKLERMAVDKEWRKKGVGRGLLTYVLGVLVRKQPNKIWCNSQLSAQAFYQQCGFTLESTPFKQYGVMHVKMVYSQH